ncbi:hypothetical protein BB560_007240, partial [Smittium megazygosporum]
MYDFKSKVALPKPNVNKVCSDADPKKNTTYQFIPIISRIDLEVVKDFVLSLLKYCKFYYQLAAAVGVSEVIYYLFFDPLRKIPGPWWSRFVSFPYERIRARGDT